MIINCKGTKSQKLRPVLVKQRNSAMDTNMHLYSYTHTHTNTNTHTHTHTHTHTDTQIYIYIYKICLNITEFIELISDYIDIDCYINLLLN